MCVSVDDGRVGANLLIMNQYVSESHYTTRAVLFLF